MAAIFAANFDLGGSGTVADSVAVDGANVLDTSAGGRADAAKDGDDGDDGELEAFFARRRAASSCSLLFFAVVGTEVEAASWV